MFHEDIYQGLIVGFTPLEEVFPRLVCGRAKSELSNHSVSLCTPAHLRVLVSTFNQGCFPRAHRHLVFYLLSAQLYRSSATFHTGWCTAVTHFAHSYCCFPLLVLSLFWFIAFQALSASPLTMMLVRLELISTVSFSPSPSHMVRSLSSLNSVDNNTSHLFSFVCLRLVSNGCYCFVSVTGMERVHAVICFNSLFLLPSLLFLRFSYLLSTRCCSDLPFLIPFLHGGPRLG